MSKYTQRAIVQSFMGLIQTKSFDKITVREIIEIAEINRNTFYYHYQDIYDLLETIFRITSERYRQASMADATFLEAYKRAADILQVNREAIIHIFNSTGRPVLIRFLRGAAMHFVKRFVEMDAEGTGLSEEGLEFIAGCYSYSVLGMVLRWIECKMPPYRMRMVETFAQSYEATVDIMIVTYRERQRGGTLVPSA